MTSVSAQTEIQCPIGLFEPQEAKIETLTKALNAAKEAADKVPIARELMREAAVLLDCASFDRGNRNCRLCRSFSELRRRTAGLIVSVGTFGATR